MYHKQGCCRGESELSLGEYESRALQDLGLTLSQVKVYLTLATIGSSTARHASIFAQVPRQDIYRILTELQQRGLVEKTITTPAKFTAIPIHEAVSILLEPRIKETAELQARTKELIHRVITLVKTPIPQENQHFVLIPQRGTLINRIKKAIENAQETIDLISSATVFPHILFVLAEKFNEAMRNGVKIRYIAHELEDVSSWPEIVKVFTKNPSFKLRTIPNPPNTRCGIYDKKEVFIATFPSRGAFQSPALWSNNPSLIIAIQDHFEKTWITAMESKL